MKKENSYFEWRMHAYITHANLEFPSSLVLSKNYNKKC